ncbi:MAG: aldo/keto reductase [Clostridia bacterium]
MNLALGTVQLGMNYGIRGLAQPGVSQALNILNSAYSEGIHVFDTASAYGTAEDVLYQFLRQPQINKERVCIISKFSSSVDNLEVGIKTSLARLGLDCFGGYLFHDANLLFDSRAVKALNGLKEKGLTKRIGVSIYTPTQAMKALEYDIIDIIQVPYNVFDRRLDICRFFKKAKDKGVEVHARSVLLQGLLVMEPETLPKHMKFAKPYLRKYREICDENNFNPFDMAVLYVLQHTDIDYIVFGVDNIDHLKEYINLYSKKSEIDIKSFFKNTFDIVENKLIMPNLW